MYISFKFKVLHLDVNNMYKIFRMEIESEERWIAYFRGYLYFIFIFSTPENKFSFLFKLKSFGSHKTSAFDQLNPLFPFSARWLSKRKTHQR